jgi:hypothetical protein
VGAWSDLDVLIVARPEVFVRFFPDRGVERLGRIDAYEQHREEARAVSRICLEDLRRLDAIVTTGEMLSRSGDWTGLLACRTRQHGRWFRSKRSRIWRMGSGSRQ